MRETIPSFGIEAPFLGAENPLGSAQNYLGKSSQSLITNKYLNLNLFQSQPLLYSQLSSDLVQRSPDGDTEFDSSELPFSKYLQINESDNAVDQTKAEQELSPTKVYMVEELSLDFTASNTPIQTSTKRKNTSKTTKAKSKTKSPTRKTRSKKTVTDVIKQTHPAIDSNPQRQKRRRPKIDFVLEQQGELRENNVTLAAETISPTSEQNPDLYSSEDLPFQPTALEQSITPVEKETQLVAAAEPVNADSSPATITTPIQLAPISESQQESTLNAVSTTEEIISSSTQKQSDRQLATTEQIIDQTIALSDRSFEPQENPLSQATAQEISVKSKAAQLQQSTEQKTGIILNQDEETTAKAILPTSPLPYNSPNLQKQRLNLPLEQRLKEVKGNEKSSGVEIESNTISNQQLTESNIAPSNLEVTSSSTFDSRRDFATPGESEAEIPPVIEPRDRYLPTLEDIT